MVELASQLKDGAMIPKISFPGGYGAYYEQVAVYEKHTLAV